jgi:hypothetical protein
LQVSDSQCYAMQRLTVEVFLFLLLLLLLLAGCWCV